MSEGFDYRGTRDRIYGIVRDGDRIARYVPSDLTMTQRALLLALVEFAPSIEPSTAALAIMLGTDERSVRRLLRGLEQRGCLRVVQRPGTRSQYEILLPHPGLRVPPDGESPRTESPHTPDSESDPPRTQGPPKQSSKADKKADKDLAPAPAAPPASAATAPPLELETQDASAAKPKRQKPKSKTTTPGHAEVMTHYATAFERRRGAKPILGGAEGTAVRTLLKKLNGDVSRACSVIDNALAVDCFGSESRTIRQIASDPSRWAAPAAPRANGARQGPVQPNYGVLREEDYQ